MKKVEKVGTQYVIGGEKYPAGSPMGLIIGKLNEVIASLGESEEKPKKKAAKKKATKKK